MEITGDKRKDFILKISENYYGTSLADFNAQFYSNVEIDAFVNEATSLILCIHFENDNFFIDAKLPASYEAKIILVFYKVKPVSITDDNIHDVVLVCSVSNSTVSTLYQTLQKVFVPALFQGDKRHSFWCTGVVLSTVFLIPMSFNPIYSTIIPAILLEECENNELNIKLQKLVTDLEVGLKSAIYRKGSVAENVADNSLAGILSLENECEFWNYVYKYKHGNEKVKAQHFLNFLAPLSRRLLHLNKLQDMDEFLEDAYNTFDDLWKLDVYPFLEQRMINLLDIIANGVCNRIQNWVKECNLWLDPYSDLKEFLTLGIEACTKWSNMCIQLTQFFWPNYSHKWTGPPYCPSSYIKQFCLRLSQIIEIRTVRQSLLQILTEKEKEELNIADFFHSFSGVNAVQLNPYTDLKWTIAVREFEQNLKPLEEQVGRRLQEQIGMVSTNTLQLLEWFKRYQHLVQLSGLSLILKSERQTLLVLCLEYLNDLHSSSSYTTNQNMLIFQLNDISPTVANIMHISQLEAKVNDIKKVCSKVARDFDDYDKMTQLAESITKELQSNRIGKFNKWCSEILKALSCSSLCLKTDQPVVYFEQGKLMRVNYDPQLVKLIKEVKQLRSLGYTIPSSIVEITDLAKKFVKHAKALEQVANFHNTIGDRMIPSQRPMMLNTALELSKLVKTQYSVTWSEISDVDKYISQLQSVVEQLAAENSQLYSYHYQIMQKVITLMSTDLLQQKNRWRDILRDIREIIAEVEKKFSNTNTWRVHWDHQLYKALECQYQIGLQNFNQYLPEIKVELVYRQQMLQFSPPIEEIHAKYFSQVKKFLTIPCTFQGVSDSSSSIFPRMVEKNEDKFREVYEKGEALFEKLFSLRDEWIDNVALGSVDMDSLIRENLKTAEDWEMNFRDCKSWGQEISKIVDCQHKLDCFTVSSAPVRSEIELHNHRYWDMLSTSLYASIMFDANTVQEFICESEKALQYEPQSLEEIGNLNEAYNKIIKMSIEMIKTVDEMDKKNKTLASWTKERVEQVSQTKQLWNSFQDMLENQHYIINKQVDGMKSKVLLDVENLSVELENFILRWKQMKPKETDFNDAGISLINNNIAILKEKRIEWNLLAENIQKTKKDCDRFGISYPQTPECDVFENELKKCEDVWGLYECFMTEIDALCNEEWIIFRSKGMQKFETFLSNWQQKLEGSESTPLTKRLLCDLQRYKDFIPCVRFLRGDAFSDKHWSELFLLLGMNFKPVDKLTLGDFLSVDDVIRQNINLLEELNNKASSEIVIRQALSELDIWEVEAKFTFTRHTDSKNQIVQLVKDFKENLSKIGDNQCLLQSITGSPNYERFTDRTKLWESKLIDLDSYLRTLNDVQRKWLYLEPIFRSETMTIEKGRFDRIDRDLRYVFNFMYSSDHRIVCLLRIQNFRQMLETLVQQLSVCQKSLNEYLEDKRLRFPRFYFLSDEDLLEILGQANKPEIVQSHLKKLFAGIHSVVFEGNNIIAMKSMEGESVTLSTPIAISLDVQQWLDGLAMEMRHTLRKLLLSCLKGADPLQFPSQILCLAEYVSFTSRCENAIQDRTLSQLHLSLQKHLDTYTSLDLEWSLDNESSVLELKFKALILDTIYHIGVVSDLMKNNVLLLSDWNWQRRIRYYANGEGNIIIRMVDAQFVYSYEYQGNPLKLVHTPLTDKCYLTLTQAMHMGLGGNPYGPAGTGKTESVKALGKLLGRQVLVFNCDEGLDLHSLTRILIGLVKCGAWGCFDEFNRLEEATLSAISMHIHVIQEALRNNQPSVTLIDKLVQLNKDTGIFITLNPAGRGYGGRRKLPDNLKQLFRPIAMSQPDDLLIAEVILYSEGFKEANTIAVKLVEVFHISKKILSQQKHYDWGLRALKTVIGGCRLALRSARQKKGTSAEIDEVLIAVQALRLNTLSKLTFSDAMYFDKLVNDIFLGVEYVSSCCEDISKSIEDSFSILGLTANSRQVHKCLEVYEQLQQRMGVVIVGPSGSGKSTISKLLKQALTAVGRNIVEHAINPKSMPRTMLLGQIDLDTRQWIDGVLSTIAQKVYDEPSNVESWIVFDGDVDPEWIESLNSVLDDNHLLTLPSGWRIQFGPNVHFIFETHDLSNASPATVSRMGIILLSEENLDIKYVVQSWLEHQPTDTQRFISLYIEDYFYKALELVKTKMEFVVRCSITSVVYNCLSMLNDVTSKAQFAIALINGFGPNITPSSKESFAKQVLEWVGEFVPEKSAISYYIYNIERGVIDSYSSDECMLDKETCVVLTAQMKSVIDVIRTRIDKGEPFLLIGPPGCGKTLLLNSCINELYMVEVVTVHCSSNITPFHLLQKLSQSCMYITTNTGRSFRPKNCERLILHLKDLNLAKVDKWGSNMLVSFLQQVLTYGGFYENNQMEWVSMDRIHIICTLSSWELLSLRFINLNRIIALWSSDDSELKSICLGYVKLLTLDQKICASVVSFIVGMYTKVKENFTNEQQSHYIFTLRDLIRWCTGIRRYVTSNKEEIIQCIVYEADRLFKDRLVNDSHKIQYNDILAAELDKSVASSSILVRMKDIIFVCDQSVQQNAELSLFQCSVNDWIPRLQHCITQLENEDQYIDKKILLPEMSKLVGYAERILTQTGGSLIMAGKSGFGRKTAVRIIAFRLHAHILQPKISFGYNITHFKNDLRSVLQLAGLENQVVYFLMEDHQIINPEFMDLISTLLASGEIPGLYQPDEFETLCSPLKDAASQNDFTGSFCQLFTQRVIKNVHIILVLDFTHPNFISYWQSNPVFLKKCHIMWFSNWDVNIMKSIPTIIPKSFFNAGNEDTIVELPCTFEDGILNMAIDFHKFSENLMDVSPRHYVLFIKTYLSIKKQKEIDILNTQTKLQAGLSKLTYSKTIVAQLKSDAASQETKLAEKQSKATTALELITKTMQNASIQKNEMEILKENVENQNKALSIRKREIDVELAEIEPVIAESRAAVGNIKPEALSEIRSLRAPPDVIRDILEGVLRLMGIQDTTWNSMKTFLAKRGVKEEIRYFDARNITSENRQSVEELLQIRGNSFEEKTAKRASTAAAPLASWVIANVKYSRILEKIIPLEKEQIKLQSKLKDAQDQMGLLSMGLDNVEQTVSKLKDQLNINTKEAAEIELHLNKAKETIVSAEDLVTKLDEEYSRWGEQLSNLSENLNTLPSSSLLSAAIVIYLSQCSEDMRRSVIKEWQKKLNLENFALEQFLCSERQQLKWISDGLPSDYLSLQNAVIISQIAAMDINTCSRPLLIDPNGTAFNWLKQHLSYTKTVECVTQYSSRFQTILELAIRFGKSLILHDVTSVHPILVPILRGDFVYQGTRKLIHVGEKLVDYCATFELYLCSRETKPNIPPNVASLLISINFGMTHSSFTQQLLRCALSVEKPELEERRVQFVKKEEELKFKLFQLQENILKELADARGNILENTELLSSLNETKKNSSDIKMALSESEKIKKTLSEECEVYMPIAENAATLFFNIQPLQTINSFYQLSASSFVRIYTNIFSSAQDSTDEDMNRKQHKLISSVYHYVCRFIFKADRLIFALHLTHIMYPHLFNPNEWELFTREIINDVKPDSLQVANMVPDWINKERAFDVFLLKSVLPDLYGKLNLEDAKRWEFFFKDGSENILANLTLFQRVLVTQALKPGVLYSKLANFSSNMLGLKTLSPVATRLDQLLPETSSTEPILLITSPGADPSIELRALANASVGENFYEVSLGREQTEEAIKLLADAARNGYWLIFKNLHLLISWLPILEKEFQCLSNIHEKFRLWLTSESHPQFPSMLSQLCLKTTYETPDGFKRNLQRTYNQLVHNEVLSSAEYAKTLFVLAWFHAIVQERRTFIPQGWCKYYEFTDADLYSTLWVIRKRFMEDTRPIKWEYICGLCECAIYGGRIDNDLDVRILKSYLWCLFNSDVINSGRMPSDIVIPQSTDIKDYLLVIQKLPEDNSPRLFSLPLNVDYSWQKSHSLDAINTLKKLSNRATKIDGTNIEEWRTKISPILHMWKQLNQELGILKMKTAQLESDQENYEPLASFLSRELNFAIELTHNVHKTLVDINKAIRSPSTLGSVVINIVVSIVNQQTPEIWLTWWDGPSNPSTYIRSIIARSSSVIKLNKIESVVSILNNPLDLSNFFNPQTFLSVLKQYTARNEGETKLLLWLIDFLQHSAGMNIFHSWLLNFATLVEVIGWVFTLPFNMASTSSVRSRSKDNIFIVGYPAHQITGCKLPSNRQVLATMFYNLRTVKLDAKQSANITVKEALIFWGKARIPTKQEYNATAQLQKLYTMWRNVQKDKNKTSEAAKNKIKKFATELDDLFDIAHQDALSMMNSEEDKEFLLKQRQKGRPGCMLGVDLKLAQTEERKLLKERAKMNKQLEEQRFDIETDEEDGEGDEEESTFDEDVVRMKASTDDKILDLPGPSSIKKMKYSRGVKEILTMKLSLLLDRCKITDRNATRIIIAVVEALGEDPEKFIVSKTAIRNKRKTFREEYTEQILERFTVAEEEPVVVHWDGKLLASILKTEQKERVAISISYGQHEQLLGVPVTDSSTGEEQAVAVFECLEEWGVSKSVRAMCFDTTSSNTGRLKGACAILEHMLDREVLYLACRHHILEVLLRSVFECKFGPTAGPQPDIFKRFQNAWPKFNKEQYEMGICNENVKKNLPPDVISNITADVNTKLTESQTRGDYKEFLQLILVFVGSVSNVVGFKSPGAIHHARWMAKAIYCLKIFLFRGQFNLCAQEESSLEAICVFLVRVYYKAWFNAPKAHLAPKQDFDLLQCFLDYQEIDKDISDTALVKFSNHLWYLNAELLALTFFDPTISDQEKSVMANQVLATTETTELPNTRNIKPKFQTNHLRKLLEEGLSDLITRDTANFFNRFYINMDFLKEPPSTWSGNENFHKGLRIVKSLKVVNDQAERGVKLISDFNNLLTKDEEQKQYVLQAVNKCRQLYPDVSKATLTKPLP